MPNLLGRIPWLMRLLGKGVNADVRPDMMEDGLARWQVNFRSASVDGDAGSLESVEGETVLYPPQAMDSSYRCIGTYQAKDDTVSFHAPIAPGLPVRVMVNGVTMVESEDIPYQWDRPLQITGVDREQGSILHPADGYAPALFWDIEAIKAAYAAGDQTYQSGFLLDYVTVIPPGILEWPEHRGNPDIGSGGARAGQYVFRLRTYDTYGNKSNLGPPTPHISVAWQQAPIYWPGADQYPGGQTTGGHTTGTDEEGTPYGIALEWQVDNTSNYAGIELVVTRWNDGAGLEGPGVTEVVAKFPVANGAFDRMSFVYPRDNNFFEEIPTDEAQQQSVNFTAPKTVETVDNRVAYMNIKMKDDVHAVTFKEVDGRKCFPITSKVSTWNWGAEYNDGFSDPVNNTYMKGAAHNERYGVGIMAWDGSGSRSFVNEVDGNFLFPERARRKTGDSLRYSTHPIMRTNTECQGDDPVSPTFDAIVQGKKSKLPDSNPNNFANIMTGSGYNPMNPRGPQDENYTRYGLRPVKTHYQDWRIEYTHEGVSDTGACFAPEVHSMGIGIYGPENMDVAVPGWSVLSVMRTAPAGRVVASGMAVFHSLPGSSSLKYTNSVYAWFPDIDSEETPLSVRDHIVNNPGQYALKFTPYGTYAEVYAARYKTPEIYNGQHYYNTLRGVDVVHYVDIQHEPPPGDPYNVNNSTDSRPQGIQPGASGDPGQVNNVGYQAWRRLTTDLPLSGTNPAGNDYLWFLDPNNSDQGASEISIERFDRVAEGRGAIYAIRTDSNKPIYRLSDRRREAHFLDTDTRRYHGPVWVVDLVRKGMEMRQVNTTEYLNTGTHIAKSRTIGIYTGPGGQNFELFHARLHDAVPRQGFPPTQRYAYVQAPGGAERRWMSNANDLGGATFSEVYAAINSDGYWVDAAGNEVYGVYSNTWDFDTSRRRDFLRFGGFSQFPSPPVGSRIIVKYDEREPIISHGFDTTTAPWTWAALDRKYNALYDEEGETSTANTDVECGAAWLYPAGVFGTEYWVPRDAREGNHQRRESGAFSIMGRIRQWVVVGHLATRTPGHLATGGGNTIRYAFPRTHYIMRPSAWWSTDYPGVISQYFQDYPGEESSWTYGGFRFQNQYNHDYSKQPLVTGLGVPRNGQNPPRDLPTGMIVSDRLNPLAQDAPGLRTFRQDNLKIADESQGEIKFCAALDQGGSQRLWVWTESGYFNIPYNTQMLTDSDGNVIGTQSIGAFWPRQENWMARNDHGMPGELWRLAAKANVPIQGNADTVFWTDGNSVYILSGATAVDIADGQVRSVLFPILSTTHPLGSERASAIYNRRTNEYWMSVARKNDPTRVFVYDAVRKRWQGEFTYDHEQYVQKDTKMVGFSGLHANYVDQGQIMADGAITSASVTVPFFQEYRLFKEAMRWRAVGSMPPAHLPNPDHSLYAPVKVEVYDAQMNLMCVMDSGTGPLWRKLYDGYEGWVNRVLASLNTARPLPQGNGFFLKVYYDTPQKIVVAGVGMQLKNIK